MDQQSDQYAARLEIEYPEALNRLTTLLRPLWAIPIIVVVALLSGASASSSEAEAGGLGIVGGLFLATVLMIVFRQRYPRWWFEFAREFARLNTRIWAYLTLMTDQYPSTEDQQTVALELDYPMVEREPLAATRQVGAGDPALDHHCRALPVCRHRRSDLVGRDPDHRQLPQAALRLRGRLLKSGAQSAVIRAPAADRPLPAVQPEVGARVGTGRRLRAPGEPGAECSAGQSSIVGRVSRLEHLAPRPDHPHALRPGVARLPDPGSGVGTARTGREASSQPP